MSPSDVLWLTPTPPERCVDGVEFARTAADAVDSIESNGGYAAVVAAYDLPDGSPWRVVERARSVLPDVTAFLRGGRGRLDSDGRPFCEYLPSRWSFGRALSAVNAAVSSRRQRPYQVSGEDRRLDAVRGFDADDAVDGVDVRALADECGVDAVAVTVVGDFLTRVVASNDPALSGSQPRAATACTYTVARDDVTWMPDFRRDARLSGSNRYECDGYRSYLGVPLRVDGETVGAVCAVDREADGVPVDCRAALSECADHITD